MKQKDLIYLLLAVAILLVAGYMVFMQIAPNSTAQSGEQVDIVGAIDSQLDSDALGQLKDPNKAKDFSSPIDYTGLNNTTPFGK